MSKLIRGLYENLVSGLLPERQYKQLMKQYDDEQAELETKIEEMEKELTEEKVNAVDIKHFISLIPNSIPAEKELLSLLMAVFFFGKYSRSH